MKKWILTSLSFLLLIMMWLMRDTLYIWLSEEDASHVAVVFIIVTVLAIVPVIPFGVVGGIVGAKYGLLWGSLLNVAASTLAAVIVYFLAANLFHTWGSKLLRKYSMMERLQKMIKVQLFWTILIARIIPIFPAAIINVYSGVFKLRFTVFLLATLLGKIPAMLVFAYVGNGIWKNESNWIRVVIIYIVFLMIVFLTYRIFTSVRSRK